VSDRLSPEQLEQMFNWDIRVSKVFHIEGAIACGGESLPELFERFLEDEHDLIAANAEQWLPGIGENLVIRIVNEWEAANMGDRFDRRQADAIYAQSMADLMRRCPITFLVEVEHAICQCILADAERPGYGTFGGGFGHYRTSYVFADSVQEAVAQVLERVEKERLQSWQKAVDEGKVHATHAQIAENFAEV